MQAGVAVAMVVVVVATLAARYTVASPLLGRVRALLPAWRFFDRATPSPYLVVRHAVGEAALGAWEPIHRARRGWWSWAFAPRHNLALAYQSAIEQLAFELGEAGVASAESDADVERDPAVTGSVSYELVSRIARAHVPPAARYQWKLVIPGDPDDALVSVELAA